MWHPRIVFVPLYPQTGFIHDRGEIVRQGIVGRRTGRVGISRESLQVRAVSVGLGEGKEDLFPPMLILRTLGGKTGQQLVDVIGRGR